MKEHRVRASPAPYKNSEIEIRINLPIKIEIPFWRDPDYYKAPRKREFIK